MNFGIFKAAAMELKTDQSQKHFDATLKKVAKEPSAGCEVYSDLKNICVWNKANGGMGALYRSKHEMILVFQNGSGPFTNNVKLGASGRYRTNIWDYPGMSSMRKGRLDDLALHPTVKPIVLVADTLRDVSKRNELALDPFSGSGTAMLSCGPAERTKAVRAVSALGLILDVGDVRRSVGGHKRTSAPSPCRRGRWATGSC
jgi:hypothetical protein